MSENPFDQDISSNRSKLTAANKDTQSFVS